MIIQDGQLNHLEVNEIKQGFPSITLSQLQAGKNPLLLVTPPLPTEIFSGRENDLKHMESCFEFPSTSIELKRQRKFVLYGVGGIGKTQIALKFIAQNKERCVIFGSKLCSKYSETSD